MESTGRMDAIKEGSRNIGFRLKKIGLILLLVFAAVGLFTTVSSAKAFFGEGGIHPVEVIRVGDITRILIDANDDTNFDIQVTVKSARALMDIESGEVFLSVEGNSFILE